MDPGGEDNPACIPKLANLNSQVGFMHVTLSENTVPPARPWPLTATHLCHSHLQHVASDSSQSKHGNHTWFEALSCTQERIRAFIKLLMTDNSLRLMQGSEMDSDP